MAKSLRAFICTCLLLAVFVTKAADSLSIRLRFDKERINEKQVLLSIKAIVASGAKLYALQTKEADVLYSTIEFDSTVSNYLAGPITETGLIKKEADTTMQAEVSYYSDSVLWQQKVNLDAKQRLLIKGKISYLYRIGDEYVPGEKDFRFSISPTEINILFATANSVAEIAILDISHGVWWGVISVAYALCIFHDSCDGFVFHEAQQDQGGRHP